MSTSFTLKLTAEELELLASLAADQLFRKEFIDPRMPGFKPDNEQMVLGKSLVRRLRSVAGVPDPRSAASTRPNRIQFKPVLRKA